MINRPRRLRYNCHIRELSRETRISEQSLIYPLFIREGKNIKDPISTLAGQYHLSPDRVSEEIENAMQYGVRKFLLFGVPNEKDEIGSSGYAENGVVQQALRELKKRFGEDVFIITDVCMCDYTSHGHCGIIDGQYVDNDKTLEYLAKIAVSQASAGSDMVAPSDMMDGRVLAIRNALDKNGFIHTPIMSYAVKYASWFYRPFRKAANTMPTFGNRKQYQMDYHNKKEAIKEALTDIQESADMLIVKPALSYLDVINEVSEISNVPVAAYSVSGEYAMIKEAGKSGVIDEYHIMCETAASIYRAGANILITYFAKELAQAIAKGDIG